MNVQDLKSIVNNVDAQDKLPVCVRVGFSDKKKSDTIVEVENFHQYSDNFLFNVIVDDDNVNKLMELREFLIQETKRFHEESRKPNASKEGSHYDRGRADGLIQVRTKLEELFNYWDCR